MRLPSALPLLFVAALATGPVRAAESYESCKGFIDTLPAVITTQGTWCLRKDLATTQASGAAITIDTNNVTIDCNGFKLGGLGAGSTTATIGIKTQSRLNAGVRGCAIRGFATGITFDGGGGHLIQDNRLDGNTLTGMIVAGDDSTIRNNLVLDTGGSTSQPGSATGIWTSGQVDVLDNTISGITTTPVGAQTVGLYINNPGFASIAGNRIRDIVAHPESVLRGVVDAGGGHPVLRNNVISGPPFDATVGIDCSGAATTTVGNVVTGFAVQVSGCTSSGDVVNTN